MGSMSSNIKIAPRRHHDHVRGLRVLMTQAHTKSRDCDDVDVGVDVGWHQ